MHMFSKYGAPANLIKEMTGTKGNIIIQEANIAPVTRVQMGPMALPEAFQEKFHFQFEDPILMYRLPEDYKH